LGRVVVLSTQKQWHLYTQITSKGIVLVLDTSSGTLETWNCYLGAGAPPSLQARRDYKSEWSMHARRRKGSGCRIGYSKLQRTCSRVCIRTLKKVTQPWRILRIMLMEVSCSLEVVGWD